MMFIKANLAPDEFGGVGVAAAESIQKGDIIWRENPKFAVRMHLAEYQRLIASDPNQAEFLMHFAYPGDTGRKDLSAHVILELATDIGSFVNHSETPNLVTSYMTDENGKTVAYDCAVRDIEAGEPILYNYRTFVRDIEAWHQAAKVRTCASFLVEPKDPALRRPKSKWRSMEAFDATLQQLRETIENLRQGSKSLKTGASAR